jgi:Ca2+-binding EF-hand superfamily protein
MDPAARFKAMDANNDGAITKDEWRGPAERFDAIDANHDGKITAAELAAAPRRGPPPAAPAQ